MHCFDPITSGVWAKPQPSMLPWTQGRDSWEMFPKRDKVFRLCIMIFSPVIQTAHGVHHISPSCLLMLRDINGQKWSLLKHSCKSHLVGLFLYFFRFYYYFFYFFILLFLILFCITVVQLDITKLQCETN